jgi:GAF domain-containing protein
MIRASQATERMREAVMQEQSLRDMAAALAATLNLDEVLDLILDNVGRVLPYDAANIQLVDGDVSRLVGLAGYEKFNVSDENLKALRLSVRETESLRTMSETRQPYIVADTRTAKGWHDIQETQWIRSNIGVPIFVGDELIGFLSIDSATPDRYTADHAARLQVFANQAATAIRNARTYGTTRRQSELMGGVTSELQHATDVNEVMEATVRALDAALQGYDIRLRLTAPQLPDDETLLIPPGDESEEKAGSA